MSEETQPALRGDVLRSICAQLTRNEFLKRYAPLWLIRPLDEEELMLWASGSGLVVAPSAREKADDTGQLEVTSSRGPLMSISLGRMPSNFGLYAVQKHDAPRGADRGVMVGREKSNDIVLSDASVSKVHARIKRGRAGTWSICDLGSRNGTTVDRQVATDGREMKVESGSSVLFGDVRCEVVGAVELHDALS